MNDGDAESREDWPELLSRQVAQHGRLLFRAAFDILKDAAAAEDVVQHAFLKVWERRGEIRRPALLKPGSCAPWSIGVLRCCGEGKPRPAS